MGESHENMSYFTHKHQKDTNKLDYKIGLFSFLHIGIIFKTIAIKFHYHNAIFFYELLL